LCHQVTRLAFGADEAVEGESSTAFRRDAQTPRPRLWWATPSVPTVQPTGIADSKRHWDYPNTWPSDVHQKDGIAAHAHVKEVRAETMLSGGGASTTQLFNEALGFGPKQREPLLVSIG